MVYLSEMYNAKMLHSSGSKTSTANTRKQHKTTQFACLPFQRCVMLKGCTCVHII